MKISISINVKLSRNEDRGFIDSLRENDGSYRLQLSLSAADPDFRNKDEMWKRDNDFSLPDPHLERKNPRYIAWMKEQEKKEENLQRKVDELKRRHLTHGVEKSSSYINDELDLSDAEWGDIPDLIRKYLGM